MASALFRGGAHNSTGDFVGATGTYPWSPRGIRWFINDAPEIEGGSFSVKWNQKIFEREYNRTDRMFSGEAIDSAENRAGSLDFRRGNFVAVRTPLVFSRETHLPAIMGGLITFEFIRKIAEDMRRHDRLTASNYTPNQLCWLLPWIDIPLMEIDWNPGGQWRPMPDSTMLYCRALSGKKPYSFLMNTDFSRWSYELSEKYMRRCLAYGIFPSFFSHDAASNRYFDRPELYERDRPLFKKYIPLCKIVAEAGWQPLTFATSSEPRVYIERFGADYFTVFNDSQETKTTVLHFENVYTAFRNLVSGETETVVAGELT
jgi:hypothetical protein